MSCHIKAINARLTVCDEYEGPFASGWLSLNIRGCTSTHNGIRCCRASQVKSSQAKSSQAKSSQGGAAIACGCKLTGHHSLAGLPRLNEVQWRRGYSTPYRYYYKILLISVVIVRPCRALGLLGSSHTSWFPANLANQLNVFIVDYIHY